MLLLEGRRQREQQQEEEHAKGLARLCSSGMISVEEREFEEPRSPFVRTGSHTTVFEKLWSSGRCCSCFNNKKNYAAYADGIAAQVLLRSSLASFAGEEGYAR